MRYITLLLFYKYYKTVEFGWLNALISETAGSNLFPPLNTQCLQNLAESGERNVLTQGSLCLRCCVRDTAWSWFIWFIYLHLTTYYSLVLNINSLQLEFKKISIWDRGNLVSRDSILEVFIAVLSGIDPTTTVFTITPWSPCAITAATQNKTKLFVAIFQHFNVVFAK